MNQTDLFGRAMRDHLSGLGTEKLEVRTQAVDWEELPVAHFFRTFDKMPGLEQVALKITRGRVLDMGAGAGAHALYLQSTGHPVVAVDSSPGAVQVMQSLGVSDARCTTWEEFNETGFDTVLLMMNGIGLAGTLENLPRFTRQWERWLAPKGRVLLESTDVAYIYNFPEGSDPRTLEPYYGEQTYRMRYGSDEVSFPWLYADERTLQDQLDKLGFTMKALHRDGQGSFLVEAGKKG